MKHQPLWLNHQIPTLTSSVPSTLVSKSPLRKSFTIGITALCGHCLCLSCYNQLDTINKAQNNMTECPICITNIKHLVRLKAIAYSDSSETEITANGSSILTHSSTVPPSASGLGVTESQQESRYTAACVPCGHLFHGTGIWQDWIKKTIHRQEEEQKAFSVFVTHPQPLHGQCPLCHDAVACVIQLYSSIPCHHSISMLNHLIHHPSLISKSSLSSSSPTESMAICDSVPRTMSNGGGTVIPHCILVTEARESAVNGTYWWNGTGINGHDSHRYIRTGTWKNTLCHFHIFVCQLLQGSQFWFLSIVTDCDYEGTDKDIDLYLYRPPILEACPSMPPQDGWISRGTQGYAPFPKLQYQQYDPVTGHVYEILPKPDQGMDITDWDEILLTTAFFCHTTVVEGAGSRAVNGTYVYDGVYNHAPRYFRCGIWDRTLHHFYIILLLHNTNPNIHLHHKHWCILVVPPDVSPVSTRSEICYIAQPDVTATTTSPSSDQMIPPCDGWTTLYENRNATVGMEPPPRLTHHEYVDHHMNMISDDSTTTNSS